MDKNVLHLAEGWCILGDLYRGQRKTEARDAYYKCVECNADCPFACKARFFLAAQKIEEKKFPEALAILKQNVDAIGDVDRAWQEKSQYKLANLLMQLKRYEEACIHFDDYVKVNNGSVNALPAREQLGECYRMLAEKENAKLKEVEAQISRARPMTAGCSWKTRYAPSASTASSSCTTPATAMTASTGISVKPHARPRLARWSRWSRCSCAAYSSASANAISTARNFSTPRKPFCNCKPDTAARWKGSTPACASAKCPR